MDFDHQSIYTTTLLFSTIREEIRGKLWPILNNAKIKYKR